jgi:mRNA interferase RelE/StbE
MKFIPTALKEWDKLDNSIKEQFKKKLSERLTDPYVHSSRLHGFENYYKIKLRSAGYRLVYEVAENEMSIIVIAINRRDKIYKKLQVY